MAKRRRRKRGKKTYLKTGNIDKFKRYQGDLGLHHLYPPKKDGFCDCGCGKELTGRQRRWASPECTQRAVTEFKIIKGDTQVIREELQKRDKNICAECSKKTYDWHADHIIEVRHGGGACGLENFQTLCIECHKLKTKENYNK